jgi:hypothetical protein
MSKKILSMILGIILMYLVFDYIGIQEILNVLYKTNIYYFLAAFGVQIAVFLLMGKRFQFIANKKKKKIGFLTAMKISFIGIFINLVTPILKVGGEPVRIFLLRREKVDTSEASAIVSTNTISELLSILFFFIASMIILVVNHSLPNSLFNIFVIFLLLSIFLMTFGIKLLLDYNFVRKTIIWFCKKAKIVTKKDYAKEFNKYITSLMRSKSFMAKILLMSFSIKALEVLIILLLFFSIGSMITVNQAIFVWCSILILSMIPFLPGNLGIMEGGIIPLIALIGISTAITASFMFLFRLVTYWILILIGVVLLYISGLTKYKEIKNELTSNPLRKNR